MISKMFQVMETSVDKIEYKVYKKNFHHIYFH